MKTGLVTFFLALMMGQVFSQEKIHWMSVEEAFTAQITVPKKVMMDVYTQWCGPCKMMSNNTFTDPAVVKYMNENYYCVKFDAESGDPVKYSGKEYKNPGFKPGTTGRNSVHELTIALGVSAYPTLLFFNETGQVITPVTGYQNVEQLEVYATCFASNAYLNIKSQQEWESYVRGFQHQWTKPQLEPVDQEPERPIDGDSPKTMSDTTGEDQPMNFAETMPEYLNGDLQADIAKRLVYPQIAIEQGIEGTVYVEFIVEKNGVVSNVKVLRGIPNGDVLNRAALEVVKGLGNFKPATQNGRPVRLIMRLPIRFALK